MKTLFEKEIGSEGAKASLVIDGGMLEAKVSYPVVKLVEKALAPLDGLKKKIEDLIPGDLENKLVDEAFAAAKTEIAKLLSE